jgi:methionyl-tRNA synthetase
MQPLLSHTINDFKPLMTRVDADKIAAIVAIHKKIWKKHRR